MTRTKYHPLKKFKVRQSWSKYNLYNLFRLQTPTASEKTFFQQKWAAKSLTRAYHGEQVREGKWELMFSKDLPAVAPMDARRLAQTDGSEWAQGRGSGLEKEQTDFRTRPKPSTPYMHMTYYPLERRLDTAVFRALFASSTRQARQFVVHGFVKVNGKKMRHPGYLLNPGDMFSVDPERVLFATGARKDQGRVFFGNETASAEGEEGEEPSSADLETVPVEEDEPAVEEVENYEEEGLSAEEAQEPMDASDIQKQHLKRLKAAFQTIKDTIEKGRKRKDISGKRLIELRNYMREIKKNGIAKLRTVTEESVKAMEDRTAELTGTAPVDAAAAEADAQADTATELEPAEADATPAQSSANVVDDNKPYQTPWRPRDYMAAFAFIPRYLEVNQNICSAVYLRHPVARPGLAEVPTPVSLETSQLAFNWYLRRR